MRSPHDRAIVDQFTRQARPFNSAATINNKQGLSLLLEAARPTAQDRLLDLACGGGIVVCAFGPHVAQATGLDITPAMLSRARQLAFTSSHILA